MSDDRTPIKTQPEKGDVMLCCPHARKSPKNGTLHVWFMNRLPFVRPDGSGGEADWAVSCNPCAVACGGDPTKLRISADVIWPGGDPLVFQKKD